MKRWVIGALVVGCLVRLPGVGWGFNWPDGFALHHPDEWSHVVNAEAIIDPQSPPRYDHPYPKAMGALVAAPMLAYYATQGRFGGPRPAVRWIALAGRILSVAFGVLSVLVVFFLARSLWSDPRIAVAAAWLLALGGLHVTQSHFFLADVASGTCLLIGLWLLWRDLTGSPEQGSDALNWAAFATGAAMALKLLAFSLPALAYATLARGPRLRRVANASVYFIAGLVIPGLGFDTPSDLVQVLRGGMNDPYQFDRGLGALLYLVQLPSIFSFPLLALALYGAWRLAAGFRWSDVRHRHALALFGSVTAVALAFIFLKLDHFPRHWVVLTPLAALAGGWSLVRLWERLRHRPTLARLAVAGTFGWMLVFVADSERFFIFDPRNDALRWVRSNVAEGSTIYWSRHGAPRGYRSLRWQNQGNPEVLVIEMYDANNYLSGIGWRNSYPADPRQVFDVESEERLRAFQSLFRGTAGYMEAARFPDRYLMPEYRLAMRLLGDRARSYVSEVVIFRRSSLTTTPRREPPEDG